MSLEMTVAIVVLWVIPIFVSSSQGAAKGRQGAAYGILGGWVGVLILAVLPAQKDKSLFGECPYCREDVRLNASVCPHCQREIAPTSTRPTG